MFVLFSVGDEMTTNDPNDRSSGPASIQGTTGPLKKLGRKKKETTPSLVTRPLESSVSPMNVVVKNRFKHTRPNQHSMVEPQKNALQAIASSYGEPPTKMTRTENSPLNLLANVTCQQQQQPPRSPLQQNSPFSSTSCPNCKMCQTLKLEEGFLKCTNCNRKLLPIANNKSLQGFLPQSFYSASSQQASSSKTVSKKATETIDLVSSDENEDEDQHNEADKKESESSQARFSDRMKLRGGESVGKHGSPSPVPQEDNKHIFECNKAMFGELYGQSVAPTRVEEHRMYLSLECAIARDGTPTTEKYTLSVGSNDVTQFLVYFGKIPSFVAIETSTKFASVACKRIGQNVLSPGSESPQKRYIILALKFAFKNDNEAIIERDVLNAALSPWAKVSVLSHQEAFQLINLAKLNVDQTEISLGRVTKQIGPIRTMLVYPPSLKSGGIPITNLDLACLDEGTYLNDIIIDFYLKFICESIMTTEQKEKTYIFNSYFYKRLTQKASNKTDPAQIHSQVKKWTRNVDIFEKDYVIIPINEHSHWYLAIVCFHGQQEVKPVSMETEEEDEEEEEETENFILQKTENGSSDEETPTLSNSPAKTECENEVPHQDPSSQASPSISENVGVTSTTTKGPADSNAPHSERNSPTPPIAQEALTQPAAEKEIPKQANESEEFKRPCILIFDSLVGSGHSRVFTNLRKYLSQEWISRKPGQEVRSFDKNVMKGCYPKIPRQNNDCDCGVFLLQYAEFFFSKPIRSFHVPIHLESWFTVQSVTQKRDDIKNLVYKLSEEYHSHSDQNKAKTVVKKTSPVI